MRAPVIEVGRSKKRLPVMVVMTATCVGWAVVVGRLVGWVTVRWVGRVAGRPKKRLPVMVVMAATCVGRPV